MSRPTFVAKAPSALEERPEVISHPDVLVLKNNEAVTRTSVRKGPAEEAPSGRLAGKLPDRRTWERRYAANVRITDTLVVCGAVILAQFVRFGAPSTAPSYVNHYVTAYSTLLVVVWLSTLAVFRSRSPRYIGAGIEEYRRVAAASFWTFGAMAMAELLLKLQISRGYLAVALPAGVLGLVLSRWIWRAYVAGKRAHGAYSTAVLAVGGSDAVANLANELTDDPKNGYRVVGACINGYGAPRDEYLVINDREIPILGGASYALQAIRECGADTVAISGMGDFGVQGLRRLIWELEPMGVDLMVSPGVMDVALNRLVMRPIAGLPLLHIDKPQYQGTKGFQKRAFDICFALAALAGTFPILVTAAIAIKLTSRGPVFYSAERIGIDGKPFSMLKFRTMVRDADTQLAGLLGHNESDGLLFKIRDDPRVTPVGRILRRFSIDELPQFINVLRQEMSVVGPRPPLRREVEAYNDDVQRRLLVKPGVTGLWQVSGRSDLSWEKSVRLDLSYVDNWSMVFDILIIAKTVRAVFMRTGAY